jgi:hypothetical protein
MGFWPYVKSNRVEQVGDEAASYVETVRRLLAARKCVNQMFNPADAQLAMQMFGDQLELIYIERGILLGCARRYVALLNGTVVGLISGLRYFSSAIQEVRALRISDDYWGHLASRVVKFERQWAGRRPADVDPHTRRF